MNPDSDLETLAGNYHLLPLTGLLLVSARHLQQYGPLAAETLAGLTVLLQVPALRLHWYSGLLAALTLA